MNNPLQREDLSFTLSKNPLLWRGQGGAFKAADFQQTLQFLF